MIQFTKEHKAAPVNPKKGFRIHLFVFLLTTPLIWLIWYFTDRTYPWPLWQTPAWVTGLLFHYLGLYVWKTVRVG